VRRQIPKGVKIKPTLFIYKKDQLSEAVFVGDEATSFLQQIFGMKKDLFERIIYMKEEDVHEFLAKPDGAVLFEIDRLIGLDKAHEIVSKVNNSYLKLRSQQKIVSKNKKEIDIAIKRTHGVTQSKTDLKKAEKRLGEISTITEDLLVLKSLFETRDDFSGKLDEIKKMAEEQDLKNLEAKLIEKQMAAEKEKSALESTISEQKTSYGEATMLQSKVAAKQELKTKIITDLSQDGDKILSCPTCGREMDEKLVKNTIKKLRGEISALEKVLQEEISKTDSILQEISNDTAQVEKLQEKMDKFKQLKESTGVILLNFNLNEEKIKELEKKKYPKTIKEIIAKLDKLDEESTNLNREIGKAEGAKEVQEDTVKALQTKENKLKHNMKIAELIIKATQATTNKLREEYTADVKNVAESIWNQYKGEHWVIEWDKDFVPIARPMSSDRPLYAFEMSGSEKFLILLAIRLAIQQSLENFQLLILDEPCQHLDETNGKIIRDVLTSIDEKKISQSIVFTYNKDYLEGDWSNIINLST